MNPSEKGFTLIEMLVAIIIGGLMTGAVTSALLIGLRTMDDTDARIAGSNDTQLIAGYVNRDIASSEYVSTIGTTFHAAPTTTASTNNSVLLSLFTLARGTTATPPNGMSEQWDLHSTGPDPANQVTVDADDDLVAAGPVSNRVLESADGTFSIDHSVVLAPASGAAIAKGAVTTSSTPGANVLSLSRPANSQSGDMLIAQVGVRGGTTTSLIAPAGWTLLDSKDAGTAIKSLVYSHTISLLEPPTELWTWTFSAAREAAGGIADYSGVGSVSKHVVDVSPCGGNPPLLLLSWTDRGTSIAHEVTYNFVHTGTEYTLVRKECLANRGAVTSQQTLARNLAPAIGAAAACLPVACGPLSDRRVVVTLTLTEPPAPHDTYGRTYQVRGSTRTTT
ncbi:MAG: hypothetical protein QOK28_3685 [Actinomycetota bacterium]|jgi:prepilin-type N-terminal cleavage/methylation domain-containing protein